MGQVEDLQAAINAARAEIEADKLAIITEIQRLGLPDQDLSGVLTSISELGSVLDDVPGVTPVPPVEIPPVEEIPVEELPAEGE